MSYTIRAQFEADFPSVQFREWLTTTEGIAGWWSDSVSGAARAPGDTFEVEFPTSPVDFELRVTEAGDSTVEWQVDENPPWWQGTTIRFDLEDTDDGCALMFTHGGFEPDDPIIAAITPAWVRFVDNLLEVARSGRANPAVRN